SALCRWHHHLRQRRFECECSIDAALWRAVRAVLLRDLRPHLAVAAAALELAGRDRRYLLGRHRDGGLIDIRPSRCQLAGAESLVRHCEERSDEAIHTCFVVRWIASLRSQ